MPVRDANRTRKTRRRTPKETPTNRETMAPLWAKHAPKLATLLGLALILTISVRNARAQSSDDFGFSRAFRFAPPPIPNLGSLNENFDQPAGTIGGESTATTTTTTTASNRSSPFVWQPLPLRATFRPLNRHTGGASSAAASRVPQPPTPPRAPVPPAPPLPPPEPLTSISERSVSNSESATGDNLFPSSARSSPAGSFGDDFFTPTRVGANNDDSTFPNGFSSSFFQPSRTSAQDFPSPAATTTTTTTPAPAPAFEADEDTPTRQPLARFRPTKAPANDEDTQPASLSTSIIGGNNLTTSFDRSNSIGAPPTSRAIMSNECFECICEASTNCNINSRCQTSDVRHTRCGMFLISYDQWLATGLSRELVTREALARDAAADERAFYDCVTQRDCSERLLTIYMQRNQKDCDRDGRLDCYDYAAIHHSGMDQCASESLLDSQYWTDFNACLGFGRRR